MNLIIHSTESLVFRDGRPFGDQGHINGGSLRWPWPSTVIGMLRNRIGLSRDNNYFTTKNGEQIAEGKIQALEEITATRIQPLWQENGDNNKWQHLFPAPADALITKSTNREEQDITFQVHGFNYEDPFTEGGVDLPWHNWRIPVAKTLEKPCRDSPELWHQDTFFTWLQKGEISEKIPPEKLGISLPLPDIRIHTAINADTGTVMESQLFSSQGIPLTTAATSSQKAGRFGIGVELAHIASGDNPKGPCYFGAERKTAFIEDLPNQFPPCPNWFTDARYLRLILISNGDFGSWAPSWLLPDHKANETNWCVVPGTDISVRLCSAFIPRWQAVSGWDYAKKGPKATRKLIPPGAVYLVELKDPSQSQKLAQIMWGRSMADNLSDPNGCGAVCIGNVSLT